MNQLTAQVSGRHLNTREGLAASETAQMWRVQTGALRIDSAVEGEARRFMRLALSGDVIGVEQWVGTDDTLCARRP
jgi:hypothetical protein